MRYLEAYTFLFRQPNWGRNLLLLSVCILIPAIGPILVVGYFATITPLLLSSPDAALPPFDFSRFSDYLQRGLWPFLVSLVLTLPLMFLSFCLGFVPMMLLPAVADRHPEYMLVFIPLIFVLMFAVQIPFYLVTSPMMLRGLLMQEFAGAFNFGFVADFIRRTWTTSLLACLFLFFTTLLVALAGECACIIGLYPAMVLIIMASHHIQLQLYQLYQDRGGTAIPIRIPFPEPPPGFPVQVR